MAEATLSGFCLLGLPSPLIQPLGILTTSSKSQGETTNFTARDIFVENTAPYPHPDPDAHILKDASRSLVVELSVEANVNLLQHLLSFLHLSARFKHQDRRSILIHLEDAKRKGVNEFRLDSFINSSKASKKSETFLEMLRKNELLVITDIIKCRKYSFEYSDSKITSAQLKVDSSIDGSGKAGLQLSKAASEEMTYASDMDITLAVKAYRILYSLDKKTGLEKYRIRKDETLKTVKGTKGPEGFSGELLDSGLVNSPQ